MTDLLKTLTEFLVVEPRRFSFVNIEGKGKKGKVISVLN
jgi:hypothetical protein